MMMTESYKITDILYVLIQWTWGILQNVMAAIFVAALHISGKAKSTSYYHGAILTRWNYPFSMGLGMFVFLGIHSTSQKYNDMVLVHEYGHTIQSCILGPMFLPVIGIPSLFWASVPVFKKMWFSGEKLYTDFYPEKWASYLGEKVLKHPAIWD